MSEVVRMARPADWSTMQRLTAEQNEAQGTNTYLPPIFGSDGRLMPNIALAFVVEREGVVVQHFYFESVPEICFGGCDAKATAIARREIERIAYGLRAMGYTGINCKVPDALAETIERPLRWGGFRRDEGLAHFFKDLRLPDAPDGE